jgi:hypothetical protein
MDGPQDVAGDPDLDVLTARPYRFLVRLVLATAGEP